MKDIISSKMDKTLIMSNKVHKFDVKDTFDRHREYPLEEKEMRIEQIKNRKGYKITNLRAVEDKNNSKVAIKWREKYLG